jgi:hypothetical protein
MQFDVNHGFLYILATIVIVYVLAQSVYFLVKAWRRGKALGMKPQILRDISISSAVFTIAPAVAILLGAITLTQALGVAVPWFRMTVYGAIHYELPAATAAANAAGVDLAYTITDPRIFSAIVWVMTLGILPALFIIPMSLKKVQSGVNKLGAKDQKWGKLFMTALFVGMISAFMGFIFADVRVGLLGWIPVFVMAISAVLMAILGLIYKKFNVKWLENYALPFSMLAAMGLSIPLTNLIGG